MRKHFGWPIAALLILWAGAASGSGQKWNNTDVSKLSAADAEHLLNDSPWATPAGAVIVQPKLDPLDKDIPLPKPANEPHAAPSYAGDGYGVDDGQWDGGVGKVRYGEPPKIPVLVRWDSALPVRAALLKTHDAAAHDSEHSLDQPEKYYIIEVDGLIPARKPRTVDEDGSPGDETPALDVEQLRNGVASTTRLLRAGKAPIPPEQVLFDEATGRLEIFFPKTEPITLADKEVVFRTSFGTLRVTQRFRLKDLLYHGQLEL